LAALASDARRSSPNISGSKHRMTPARPTTLESDRMTPKQAFTVTSDRNERSLIAKHQLRDPSRHGQCQTGWRHLPSMIVILA
jgi:hypothetical protein